RRSELKRLVVSKVANFAIDLPDANVAIQVSGTFGSRQEEAQRLGRLLRPKSDGRPAHFYTIVTRDTRDQDFSANRQLFLTEQGYRYTIEDAEATGLLDEVPAPASRAEGATDGGGGAAHGVNGVKRARGGRGASSTAEANGAHAASANGANGAKLGRKRTERQAGTQATQATQRAKHARPASNPASKPTPKTASKPTPKRVK